MAVVVAAVLVAGCGGDDDDSSGGFGASADPSTEQAESGGDGSADDGLTGADGEELPEFQGGDGDLADFPIPSPPGALEAIVTEVDGMQVATIVYAADRYDEVVDHYESWFLDNGLIAETVDRSFGLVALGGANESGAYFVSIVTDGDVLQLQLSAA